MELLESDIRNLVTQIGGVPADASPDADLYLDLGMASVHALQLLTELEDKYNIQIPDEQFVEATSISRLTSIVRDLLAQPQ